MKLTLLTLQGFKSFGDRVTIEFAPGITAVVGPNGSGKSNVIDGLKWATGGGRASMYRASEQTDLIFHGAAGKRSVGLAEVELELRGPHRTHNIYRSLDREGTTRLRLNGRASRFLDVDEALAGTGFGRNGLAIVGQGEVSQVLMADPNRLLDYIAEAAGVSRLSGRREQAQARLQTARGNLDRLADMLLDLETQVERLSAEANDARRHAELAKTGLELRYTMLTRRLENQQAAQKTAQQELAALEEQLRENRYFTRQAEQQHAELVEAERESERLLRVAAAELEAARGELNVARERLERHAEQEQRYAQLIVDLEREQTELAALEEPAAPSNDPAAMQRERSERDEAFTAATDRVNVAENNLRTVRERITTLTTQLRRVEQATHDYESRSKMLDQQLQQTRDALTLAENAAEPDTDNIQQAAETAEKRVKILEEERETHTATLRKLHEQHADAVAELRSEERSVERLTAAYEARSGYAHGPRAALTSGIPGVLGSVAELFAVAPEYQEAVAALLGRRAEYVLVDTADTAVKVLAHVKTTGGYVTVLPLDVVRARNATTPAIAREAGVLAIAREHVETEPRYDTVLRQLLGDSVIVDSTERAAALARQFAQRPRLVTVTGELVEPSGAMSGGRRQRGPTVLGAAAELEKATAALELLREREEHHKTALADAQQHDQKLRTALEEAREQRTAARQRWQAIETEQARRHGMSEELTERLRTLEAAVAALERPVEPTVLIETSTDTREVLLSEAVNSLTAEQTAHETAVVQAREQQQAARERVLAIANDVRFAEEQQRHYEAERERYTRAQTRKAHIVTELHEATQQHQAAVLSRTEAAQRAETLFAALPKDVSAQEAQVKTARANVLQVQEKQVKLQEEREELAERIDQLRVQLARREAAIELAQEDQTSMPAGVTLLDITERAARLRLTEVENELEEIGPVNQRAERDLQELTDRYEDSQVEIVQATLAVTELESALERIDRETNTRLEAALKRVQHNFTEQIQLLFGENGAGGIDPVYDEGRLSGVRIRLQPPGKQTESLHLLSVGERTMGALAFLFSLMSGTDGEERLPIAVLDEVDAPLDEANIRRFCAFVEQLAQQGTQFILITHQKATFEIADILWGVTSEAGVSRVFSVAKPEEVGQVVTS